MNAPAAAVLAFFEVHLWPHEGRLLLINKEPHREAPILTWLQVSAVAGVDAADAVVAVGHALGAGAGLEGPEPLVVLHDRHGNMLGAPAGLGVASSVLRRAAGR